MIALSLIIVALFHSSLLSAQTLSPFNVCFDGAGVLVPCVGDPPTFCSAGGCECVGGGVSGRLSYSTSADILTDRMCV